MTEMPPSPGLHPDRVARLLTRVVDRVSLDLSGRLVLTEAATGAYAVTSVLAALAGAGRVVAVTRSSRFGSVADARGQTAALLRATGLPLQSVDVVEAIPDEVLAAADVVTNTGHLRPLDTALVSRLKPRAVVPLMFEAWEIEAGRHDVDLVTMRARGIRFAGTNERHPAVDVFTDLGAMATRLLHDAGVIARGSRVVVLCDNAFDAYIRQGLAAAGARLVENVEAGVDAVLVARTPTGAAVVTPEELTALAAHSPGAVLAQFWGDIDRSAAAAMGIPVAPVREPAAGHMGILPSALGPEPIVRLQAGGLKVAQVLLKEPDARTPDELEYLDEL